MTHLRHGHSKRASITAEYNSWISMKTMCNNPNYSGYSDYGGRGISVCDRWGTFDNFLKDMGKKPSPKHSLDRIDNDGNYEPGNCRWATRKQQSRNRRGNRLVNFKGSSMPLAAAIEISGLGHEVVNKRIQRGWTVGAALSTPLDASKSHPTN